MIKIHGDLGGGGGEGGKGQHKVIEAHFFFSHWIKYFGILNMWTQLHEMVLAGTVLKSGYFL